VSASTVPTAVVEPLLRQRERAGVFTDFDGTLSEIVDDPDLARPVDGSVEAIVDLSRRFARVGVLSGRPVSFLERFFPSSVLLAGLYGLETSFQGVRSDHPQGGVWREVVDDVASVSRARGPAGMRVESKGLSITLHYRERPELADAVQAWAGQQAARSGLLARPARMSYELHPPIPADKGTALHELADDLEAVCFIGDDAGDLCAFDALDELASHQVLALRVAVRSLEEPPELRARADVEVDGPAGVLALLQQLRGDARP
jgi:trehalose 6-phosphate phosphatase